MTLSVEQIESAAEQYSRAAARVENAIYIRSFEKASGKTCPSVLAEVFEVCFRHSIKQAFASGMVSAVALSCDNPPEAWSPDPADLDQRLARATGNLPIPPELCTRLQKGEA